MQSCTQHVGPVSGGMADGAAVSFRYHTEPWNGGVFLARRGLTQFTVREFEIGIYLFGFTTATAPEQVKALLALVNAQG